MGGAVELDDLVLVSVDDHIVEPPHLFDAHIPDRYRAEAPRVVRRPDATDAWVFGGDEIEQIGLNAVMGRVPEEYGMDPASFDEFRPGALDVHERVRDMDANGVLASLCFPSFPGFCGQVFSRPADKDLALAVVRAYNDWHLDEWCGAHPGRFIPLAVLPLWDPALMAQEVRRVAARGCHAVSFSENPEKILGLPNHYSDHWDPFWAACADEGTVVCMHINNVFVPSEDTPMDVIIASMPASILSGAADLLWSPILRKFPSTRIALSEGGIGWIPWFLARADWTYERHRAWTGADFGGRWPSEVFREHFLACFIHDPVGVTLRDQVGVECLTWECDYPHSDSTWPRSPEALSETLSGVSDHDVDRITHQNALAAFRFDPGRPRDECTVGALRARATDVDLTLRSFGHRVPPEQRKTKARHTRDHAQQSAVSSTAVMIR
jgi:predicted TIM-barrel fold metal-dependent hydrolase